jgi:hypothetical protein
LTPRSERLWENFLKIHTPDEIDPVEGERILRKLWRTVTGETFQGTISVGHGRSYTDVTRLTNERYHVVYAPSRGWYSILQGLCNDLWLSNKVSSPERALYTCINSGIKRGYFVGLLTPEPKPPKPKPTKEAIRAVKIKRLEAREAAWCKKQIRAINAVRKIRRQLKGLRAWQQQ